jgi:hypothetical protein
MSGCKGVVGEEVRSGRGGGGTTKRPPASKTHLEQAQAGEARASQRAGLHVRDKSWLRRERMLPLREQLVHDALRVMLFAKCWITLPLCELILDLVRRCWARTFRCLLMLTRVRRRIGRAPLAALHAPGLGIALCALHAACLCAVLSEPRKQHY